MIRSQQRRSHIANWRRTVYDDDPEPVQIQHGIEAVPIPPGLEQIPVEHHRQANAPQVVLGKEGKEVLTEHDHGPSESRPSVRKWFWILVAATVVAVAIAVAVGVGVVVRRRTQAHNNHSSPDPRGPRPTSAATSAATAPNAIVKPPLQTSTSGAFKGTGMVFVDNVIFFQDYVGQIRSSEVNGNAWLKKPTVDIVVGSNVKIGTPISGISYTQDVTTMVRLFYIDSFNIVQEAVKSNTSNNWVNGSLGASNWQASGSSSVALAACNNYQFYNATGNGGGVRLFYGVDNNTVRELIYSFGTQEWTGGHSFAGADGDGGLACAGLNNAVTYLWFLNQQNQLEYCWYHFDSSLLNDPNHPPNTWVQGPAADTPVRAKSAISMHTNIYFQDPSDHIVGIAFTQASENSTWNSLFGVGGGVETLPGTRMASTTVYATADTPDQWHVFFQNNGSDIMEYLGSKDGGVWSSYSVLDGQ